jgi:hypothetical protein
LILFTPAMCLWKCQHVPFGRRSHEPLLSSRRILSLRSLWGRGCSEYVFRTPTSFCLHFQAWEKYNVFRIITLLYLLAICSVAQWSMSLN